MILTQISTEDTLSFQLHGIAKQCGINYIQSVTTGSGLVSTWRCHTQWDMEEDITLFCTILYT